jgi:hypothetical protein
MSRLIFYILAAFFVLGCSRSEGGRARTVRESLDLWTFSTFGTMVFDSVPLEDLRGVHLAGAGLLNRDVLVAGTVDTMGAEGTYIVLTDASARMLVDTTRLSAAGFSRDGIRGRRLIIHGEVKSGDKGHIYLMANALRRG